MVTRIPSLALGRRYRSSAVLAAMAGAAVQVGNGCLGLAPPPEQRPTGPRLCRERPAHHNAALAGSGDGVK